MALSTFVVCKAVAQNLYPLSEIMSSCNDPETLHAITSVIELLPLTCISSLPLQLMLRLTNNCVKFFFVCVSEKGISNNKYLITYIKVLGQHIKHFHTI